MRHVRTYERAKSHGSERIHFEVGPDEPGVVEHRPRVIDALIARNPSIRRFEVHSPRILPAHDGLLVAHITDLHIQGHWSTRRIRRAVAVLNTLKPDVIALTGDYVCYSRRALPHLADALRGFKAPVFATLGNHDHWLDAAGVRDALLTAGATVLSNQHQTITLRGQPFHVVGIDDGLTGHAIPDLAFDGLAAGGTRLVLSHIAEIADGIGGHGAALVLSGHTHAGQVVVPGVTKKIFEKKGHRYVSGFFRTGGQVLYVSSGIGASVPIRIGAPTEVALLSLRCSPKPAGVEPLTA